MQRRGTFLPIFLIVFFVSFAMLFLAQKGFFNEVTGLFEQITVPFQRLTFGVFHHQGIQTSQEKLQAENSHLLTLLTKQKELERENQALHDQFQTANPSPK